MLKSLISPYKNIFVLNIPKRFFEVRYNGSHFPGAYGLDGLKGGANCQVFVYELLVHFGYDPLPDFRSSELWEDAVFTRKVTDIQPMDILFWNKKKEAWGAHVGLALGEGKAIHLSKENGVAEVWELEKFELEPQYAFFLGAKRPKK